MNGVHTNGDLNRRCINILDDIYSKKESLDYLAELEEIQIKLFSSSYSSYEDFEADIQNIPLYKTTKRDAGSVSPVLEEDCNTPIYEFVTLRNESQIYTININEEFSQLHQSLIKTLKEENTKRSLHRLYISKGTKMLLKTRDDVNSVLVLFFNLKSRPFEDNKDIMLVTADIQVVHPIGKFYHFADETRHGLQGWIKVRIARKDTIKRVISKELITQLISKDPLSIRKIKFEKNDDIDSARNNEMTRQFITAVMGSCLDLFTPCHDDFVINSLSVSDENVHNQPSKERDAISLEMMNTVKEGRYFLEHKPSNFTHYWNEIRSFCVDMKMGAVYNEKYEKRIDREADAEGYFKKVYFINDQSVAQIFQRSTVSQRINEIVSYSMLRNKKHVGCIKEVIWKDDKTEIIGMTMERYEMTLKQFLRKNPKLTACQRLQMITQLLKSISTIHEFNIAHRDVSTVNFMVNTKNTELLEDGSSCIELFLIDFGKAVFFDPKAAAKWWVNSDEVNIYRDEVKPKTTQELIIWCKSLPFMMAKPDHGYRFYRSIKTLPRHRNDHTLFPYLIDPAAEDIFALGSLVWKVLSGMEPWPGIFDTDLRSLRETVEDDYNIRALINREVPGITSRALLYMFLRAEPFDRRPAAEILSWLESPGIRQTLLNEWNGIYDRPAHTPARKRKRTGLRKLQ